MIETNEQDRPMDWDDTEAVDDGSGFVLLPEGTYPFEVVQLEKERYAGGEKIPPCPRAVVHLAVDAGEAGKSTVRESMLLHTRVQFRVAKFFEALGFPKDPETNKVKIDWSSIIGKTGVARIGIRKYTKNGEEREANEVKEFIVSEAAGAGQQQGWQPGQGGF